MVGKICVSRDGEIATVTISQPGKRNALTVDMWSELKSAFEQVGADEALRCIVLRGDGDDAFSAGADMSEFERVRSTRQQVVEFHERRVLGALTAIAECPIPVVAATIGGVCMGGGLEIAAVCDLRIAGDSSRSSPEVGVRRDKNTRKFRNCRRQDSDPAVGGLMLRAQPLGLPPVAFFDRSCERRCKRPA